ncbi:hypothetical protein JTB14_031239 [Gonioctena quinquepunctata]|nr:hypothetical protein JTB14_031239 [Gonioctena quinquepunctata]
MKCVILFSVFALCYSTPLIFENEIVNIDDDGTITVTGTNGRKMVIAKVSNEVGPDIIKLSVEDPFTSKKIMKIVNVGQSKESTRIGSIERLLKKWKGVGTQSDESNESDESHESSENVMTRSHRVQSGTDVLTEIFGQHQGVVGDDTFQEILKSVDELVRSGELDNSIYEVLKEFVKNTPISIRRGSSMFRPTSYFSDEVSFYLYKGLPFAYRYTDILPNSGLNEEFLQIMGDSQGNNLELVPLQKMMQDPVYQPALMEYLGGSHQSIRFQSTHIQTIPELFEQLSRIHRKHSSNQQHDFDEEEQREIIR